MSERCRVCEGSTRLCDRRDPAKPVAGCLDHPPPGMEAEAARIKAQEADLAEIEKEPGSERLRLHLAWEAGSRWRSGAKR